MIYVLAKKTT